MSRNVLVVIGSRTNEDQYGVESGHRVAAALQRHGWNIDIIHAREGRAILRRLTDLPPDLVVPVGFGPPCEDGHIYGLARMAAVPCAGPTPAAGSLMQDKSNLSKIVDAVFPAASGIRSPRGITLAYRILPHEVAERLHAFKAPFVVKPSFSGSSDGLCVKDTHLDAAIAANTMLEKEGKVLIQELERQVAHEVSCTVLDQPYGPNFLPIIEIRRDDVAVFGVEEKFGAQSLGRHIIPARIDSAVSKRIEQAVITLHREIGSIGLTRTDILVLKNGEIVILEVNGIPGLLTSSIACDAAQAAGISFEELCILYAQSAYIRRAEPDVWGGLV